jgi:hypothetical protein
LNKTGAVTVLLIILAVIALIAHVSTTNLEFSRYNGNWAGTSKFFAELDVHDARDIGSYDGLIGRDDTLLLILAPNTSFSLAETAALRDFLEYGNTVFVADETGISNSMLEGMGSHIRIQPGDISSVEMEFWDYLSVIAYARESDPLLTNVSSITFNRPSSVEGGEILVSTTLISWDDTNQNYRLDANETLSSFGILTREQVGNGTLYVLSDPSIFINGMHNTRLSGDNMIFNRNLLSLHQNILVEQSHSLTGGADSLLVSALWVKNSMIIKISSFILSLMLVLVAFWRKWI